MMRRMWKGSCYKSNIPHTKLLKLVDIFQTGDGVESCSLIFTHNYNFSLTNMDFYLFICFYMLFLSNKNVTVKMNAVWWRLEREDEDKKDLSHKMNRWVGLPAMVAAMHLWYVSPAKKNHISCSKRLFVSSSYLPKEQSYYRLNVIALLLASSGRNESSFLKLSLGRMLDLEPALINVLGLP